MVSRKHILMLTARNIAPWVFLDRLYEGTRNLSKIRGHGYANVCRCCSSLSIYTSDMTQKKAN